jgi:hypothetical protein
LRLKQLASWVPESKIQKIVVLFVLCMEQFIRAMEQAEAKSPPAADQLCISDRNGDREIAGVYLPSWKRFDVDEIYNFLTVMNIHLCKYEVKALYINGEKAAEILIKC